MMRSPNHQEVKSYCRSVIPKLLLKHQLGEPLVIELDAQGWVNPCFFVNDDYVFRFNARDTNLPKYQREKYVYDLLKESKVPVPSFVILDQDQDCCRFDVLISKKVSGRNLEVNWRTLDRRDQKEISKRAGEILRDLHTKTFSFYGELANRGPLPRTLSWQDYIVAKLDFLLEEAKTINLFNLSQEQQFLQKYHCLSDSLLFVKEACLVHGDYHFGNLLYEGTEINSVVDFEWSLAGDPLLDLMFWLTGDESFPGSQTNFFLGYGKDKWSVDEENRLEIYQMLKNIELTIVAKRHFPDDEAQEYFEVCLASSVLGGRG